MKPFVNVHLHSYYSMLDSCNSPKKIVNTVKNLGQNAVALTDHAGISGFPELFSECKKANIKAIAGNEFNICDDIDIQDKNNRYKHQVIIARNLKGWLKLVKLTSLSNDKGFYYKPRIDWKQLEEIADDNLISFSGHPGSTLCHILSEDDVIRPDAINKGVEFCERMRAIFKDGFFIEVQVLNNSSFEKQLADCLRQIALRTGIKTIATGDCHYATKDDVDDHRLILCSNLKLTLPSAYKQLSEGKLGMDGFFKGKEYFIRSWEDLENNTEQEKNNTVLLSDMVENYNIFNKPMLPNFICPNGLSETQYLRELCRNGWKEKNRDWGQNYVDRIKYELDVINKSKVLESYFLIVDDIVRWARNNNIMTPCGRGSSAGSLVSYLLGIINVNPIPYGLIFERFYNEGRNTEDHIALPDIDLDFPVYQREKIINYIKDKYGKDNVCQMSTYGTLQGKGAIKEVLRVRDTCDFRTSNEICNNIPDESRINDQMEESGEKSVLSWILKYDPKTVQKYCQMDENGELHGEYADEFAQAIRIEGTIKSQGKHPSGLIIAPVNLNDYCPMVKPSTSTDKISGFDMYQMENCGFVKFDILGVSAYDKLSIANDLIKKRIKDESRQRI